MTDPKERPTAEQKAVERLLFRATVTVLAVLFCVLVLPVCWHLLSPFIIAIPLAATLQPAIRFLQKRFRLKPTAAVIIPVLLVLIICCFGFYWFVSFGVSRMSTVVAGVPSMLSSAASSIRTEFENLMTSLRLPSQTESWLRSALNDGLSQLTVQATVFGTELLGSITNMATSLPYVFIYLNFLIIGVFFIAKEYKKIRAILPGGRDYDPNTNASRLTTTAIQGALGYLRVQVIFGLVNAVFGGIFFQCVGFQYGWLIGISAGLLEMIPLFGSGTLYLPWAIIAYLRGSTMTGTYALGVYLFLMTVRRLTEPKLMAASIGVSPLTSLIGMFVGFKLGGILGLIGGPILMTLIVAVFKGHYLDGVLQDVNTLVTYFRKRWNWVDPKPYTPPPEPEETAPPKKQRKPVFPSRRRK